MNAQAVTYAERKSAKWLELIHEFSRQILGRTKTFVSEVGSCRCVWAEQISLLSFVSVE